MQASDPTTQAQHVDVPSGDESTVSPTVLYEADAFFRRTYDEGISLSGTPDVGEKRRARFYGLVQALKATGHLEGGIVECGCWKGLSAYLMCRHLASETPVFTGEDLLIVDSFLGLSAPTQEDVVQADVSLKGIARRGRPFKSSGAYAAPLEHVRAVLCDFPSIRYAAGWIPEVLDTLPPRQYRFVHVDLDLYAPILGALRYFYPRLVRGGIIVSDDYGSLFFPGAHRAVEEFCAEVGTRAIASPTGQAIIVKV